MELTSYRIDRPDADRLLFLFHGFSAEQHHLAAYVPLIDPGERFTAICPRAPHPVPGSDGASWFAITDRVFDGTQLSESVEAVRDLVAREAAAAGVALERCVVGGFSQGGYLAQALVAEPGGPRFAGAWTMCCGRADAEDLALDYSTGDDRPALVQYGLRDEIIAPERAEAVAAAFTEGGWAVRSEGYDMAHSQTIEMMVTAREWLSGIL